jgi:hypothetical protein
MNVSMVNLKILFMKANLEFLLTCSSQPRNPKKQPYVVSPVVLFESVSDS